MAETDPRRYIQPIWNLGTPHLDAAELALIRMPNAHPPVAKFLVESAGGDPRFGVVACLSAEGTPITLKELSLALAEGSRGVMGALAVVVGISEFGDWRTGILQSKDGLGRLTRDEDAPAVVAFPLGVGATHCFIGLLGELPNRQAGSPPDMEVRRLATVPLTRRGTPAPEYTSGLTEPQINKLVETKGAEVPYVLLD